MNKINISSKREGKGGQGRGREDRGGNGGQERGGEERKQKGRERKEQVLPIAIL